MIKARQATLVSIQEREKDLGVDLWQVPWQDLACNTHVLEHNTAQRRIAFPLTDGQQAAQHLCKLRN
jgi:hypothetical protein